MYSYLYYLGIVFEIDLSPKVFKITCMFNPLTYNNKLLIGSLQGPLHLWNIRTKRQLYWFKGFGSSVTCIQQAPMVDLCAIGVADGSIYLHNLKFDETLLHFTGDGGAITSLDFRTGTYVLFVILAW